MKILFEKKVMAIVPKYVDSRGNCTIVHRKDSEPLVLDKSIKTVIRLIGKHYMIDLEEMKKRHRELLYSRILIPIPINQEDIFIPFKTRIPRCKNDGAFSYINMKYIKDIKKDNNISMVYLTNGFKFKCLSTMNTIDKHMKNGNIISRCYEENSREIRESKELYNNYIILPKYEIDIIYAKLDELLRKGI